MGKALFITGTGTDIGKTYVTGLIVKKMRDSGYNAGYYKAALSGAEPDAQGELQPGDALHVNEVAGLGETIPHLVSYVYREAVSPHLAARLNDQPIDLAKQHVILDDLVKKLQLATLIIADAGLGTINAAVLSIEHLRNREIPVQGVILNNYHPGDLMEDDNAQMIEEMTGVPIVARVQHGDTELDIDPARLASLYAD